MIQLLNSPLDKKVSYIRFYLTRKGVVEGMQSCTPPTDPSTHERADKFGASMAIKHGAPGHVSRSWFFM
jgi:hypothetical protein